MAVLFRAGQKENFTFDNLVSIYPQSGLATQVTQLNPVVSVTGQDAESLLVDNVIVQENSGDVTTATAIFVDDAAVVTRDMSSWATPAKSLYATSDQMTTEQSLKEFLAKPISIASGTFATTDVLTTITSTSMPYGIMSTAGGLMWRSKLSGYFGIRMTMNFRIVVNANRFQQGRYIMSFTHFGGGTTNGTKTQLVNSNFRLPTLVQRTTVPHVEVDLNCDTAAELSIPYVSIRTFQPIHEMLNVPAGEQTTLGYLNLYPYSPLVTVAGSTTAPYRIYCWFTDVELVGAASPQSGLPRSETANKSNGVVSGPLNAVARGFKEFEQIPLLSTYARNISWVADRLSRTAAMFGLSKPMQGDSLMKIMPLSAPSHTTVDGDSDARSLATISQPGVLAVEGLSGTKFDEMDFSYISQKFAWFQNATWTTSSAVDVSLTGIAVTPNKSLTVAGPVYNFTPVGFVTNCFTHWRGGVKFRFKFVKTEFHSGRLAFDFFPNLPGVGNLALPEYVNRVIIDIREHSEVEILVPYTSNAMYTDNASNIGTLVIRVIDPLVAPATVSSTVNILCEVAGHSDIEFYGPRFSCTPQGIVPQSGLSEDCKIFCHTIGNTTSVANPTLASSVAAGEKVSNFRALIKRFTPFRGNAYVPATVDNFCISVLCDALPLRASSASLTYVESDSYGCIAFCYAIVGGGVRFRDVVSAARLTKQGSPLYAMYDTSFPTNSAFLITPTALVPSQDTMNNGIIQEVQHNCVLTVEIPQYSNYIAKATSDLMMEESGAILKYNPNATLGSGNGNNLRVIIPAVNGPILPNDNNTGLHSLYRAGADDANFYSFVSIPPLVQNGLTGWDSGY